MTDPISLRALLDEIKSAYTDLQLEVYNLAAQSHVQVSFSEPVYTMEVNQMGVVHLLEAIYRAGLIPVTKFYQASTSELFGNALRSATEHTMDSKPVLYYINEETEFRPESPYAMSKWGAYWWVKHYQQVYGLYACNGILFNHESERRGSTFVTRKIVQGVVRIARGESFVLELGNLEAKRDWGYAADYARAIRLMMQQESPRDYVVATGESHSVREFVQEAFRCVGRSVQWEESGTVGKDPVSSQVYVRVVSRYFRRAEVHDLCGDATRIRTELGWMPTLTFHGLVRHMVEAELALTPSKHTLL
jgi:GDPmannose 4,6-dehydratase